MCKRAGTCVSMLAPVTPRGQKELDLEVLTDSACLIPFRVQIELYQIDTSDGQLSMQQFYDYWSLVFVFYGILSTFEWF